MALTRQHSITSTVFKLGTSSDDLALGWLHSKEAAFVLQASFFPPIIIEVYICDKWTPGSVACAGGTHFHSFLAISQQISKLLILTSR
jgi:hypothetical protein